MTKTELNNTVILKISVIYEVDSFCSRQKILFTKLKKSRTSRPRKFCIIAALKFLEKSKVSIQSGVHAYQSCLYISETAMRMNFSEDVFIEDV